MEILAQSVKGESYQMYVITYKTFISSANKYYKCKLQRDATEDMLVFWTCTMGM